MNGVHDMGGMECYGELDLSSTEQHFHHEWEKRVLALCLAMGATGQWNLDKSRFTRESLPPNFYLSAGYYRIWLAGLESLLLEFSLVSEEELRTGSSTIEPKALTPLMENKVAATLSAGSPVDRPSREQAAFRVGEHVLVSRSVSTQHTRCPAYVRGCIGVIHTVHGNHVFPDDHAQMKGENPQWLYNVKFSAQQLWGAPRSQAADVHVDLWQPYLQAT